MHPDEVPHEYVMAAMKAAGLLHHDTARPALAAVLPMHRARVLREAAEAVMVRAEQTPDMTARIGLGVAHYVLTEMADAATPTSKEQ